MSRAHAARGGCDAALGALGRRGIVSVVVGYRRSPGQQLQRPQRSESMHSGDLEDNGTEQSWARRCHGVWELQRNPKSPGAVIITRLLDITSWSPTDRGEMEMDRQHGASEGGIKVACIDLPAPPADLAAEDS